MLRSSNYTKNQYSRNKASGFIHYQSNQVEKDNEYNFTISPRLKAEFLEIPYNMKRRLSRYYDINRSG